MAQPVLSYPSSEFLADGSKDRNADLERAHLTDVSNVRSPLPQYGGVGNLTEREGEHYVWN